MLRVLFIVNGPVLSKCFGHRISSHKSPSEAWQLQGKETPKISRHISPAWRVREDQGDGESLLLPKLRGKTAAIHLLVCRPPSTTAPGHSCDAGPMREALSHKEATISVSPRNR